MSIEILDILKNLGLQIPKGPIDPLEGNTPRLIKVTPVEGEVGLYILEVQVGGQIYKIRRSVDLLFEDGGIGADEFD